MKEVPLCFVNYLERNTRRILPQWKCNHPPNSLGSFQAVIDMESSIRVHATICRESSEEARAENFVWIWQKQEASITCWARFFMDMISGVLTPTLLGCMSFADKKKKTEEVQQLAQSHPTCKQWSGDLAVDLLHSKLTLSCKSCCPQSGVEVLSNCNIQVWGPSLFGQTAEDWNCNKHGH